MFLYRNQRLILDVTIMDIVMVQEIVPRVAINNPDIVDNIGPMGALAENLREIGDFQGVSLPVLYAQQVLGHNHNGLISGTKKHRRILFYSLVGNLTLVLAQNITTANGTGGTTESPI